MKNILIAIGLALFGGIVSNAIAQHTHDASCITSQWKNFERQQDYNYTTPYTPMSFYESWVMHIQSNGSYGWSYYTETYQNGQLIDTTLTTDPFWIVVRLANVEWTANLGAGCQVYNRELGGVRGYVCDFAISCGCVGLKMNFTSSGYYYATDQENTPTTSTGTMTYGTLSKNITNNRYYNAYPNFTVSFGTYWQFNYIAPL